MIHIVNGKTYIVGEQGEKYFFAWATDDSFTDELPTKDVNDEESGVQWFETREKAFQAYLNAIDAVKKE